MAVTRSVTVYGFGSAFADVAAANDVDLLIIHPETNAASCELAIRCKHHLAEHIARVHVTMLSASEEAHFQFIKRARALGLGIVRNSHLQKDFEALLVEIQKRSAQSLVRTM
ncbi:2-phosphoglycerate kinase [Mesorhizobium soli]|uniref:hypothetical protein n=1 Tax=Pseudaminobacter soli (ex Li et al. 2025) TaxID=1295366 RepID=UPI002476709C|nr:hypothetical protein [Mesorhizobium soli]MDH6234923.1 2-phosphoglycerate kinase [Mesorhizobium soli]